MSSFQPHTKEAWNMRKKSEQQNWESSAQLFLRGREKFTRKKYKNSLGCEEQTLQVWTCKRSAAVNKSTNKGES